MFVTAILYPILAYAFVTLTHAWVLAIVLIPVYLYLLRMLSRRAAIYRSGFEGEKRALNMFEGLPDTYTVFHDIDIQYEDRTSQIDTVVVGPTGVFVIETKNVVGRIEGQASSREWTQHKQSKGGNAYTKTFYNPTKQVGTHVYRLAHFLKSQGVQTWVQGIVFFSNPEADVHVQSYQTPVFSQSKEGPAGILGFVQAKREESLSPTVQEAVIRCLSSAAPTRTR